MLPSSSSSCCRLRRRRAAVFVVVVVVLPSSSSSCCRLRRRRVAVFVAVVALTCSRRVSGPAGGPLQESGVTRFKSRSWCIDTNYQDLRSWIEQTPTTCVYLQNRGMICKVSAAASCQQTRAVPPRQQGPGTPRCDPPRQQVNRQNGETKIATEALLSSTGVTSEASDVTGVARNQY